MQVVRRDHPLKNYILVEDGEKVTPEEVMALAMARRAIGKGLFREANQITYIVKFGDRIGPHSYTESKLREELSKPAFT